MQTEDTIIRSSGENNIELIKEYRDELPKQLMQNDFLKEYLEKHFHLTNPSAINWNSSNVL